MIKYREIVASTQVQIKNNKTGEAKTMKDEQEYMYSGGIEEHPVYVSVRAAGTVNLGNFESGRIEIGLSWPSKAGEVDNVFEKTKEWIDKRLSKEITDLRESGKSRKVDI